MLALSSRGTVVREAVYAEEATWRVASAVTSRLTVPER
jgi:hypothetical protein